jgi:hypothetical protein
MNKKNIFGIITSLIGLGMMGFEMGRRSKIEESNGGLHYAGLLIVFVGAFIVIAFNKKKTN